MPPQGVAARKGILAVLAVGRFLARVVVVSVVFLERFDLLLCRCLLANGCSRVSMHICFDVASLLVSWKSGGFNVYLQMSVG